MSASASSREVYDVSGHRLTMAGDIAQVTLNGLLRGQEARALLALTEQEIKRLNGFFLLLDVRTMSEPPDNEARHVLVEWSKRHPPVGAAVVGANMLMRTLVTLAARSTTTFSNRVVPPRFFSVPEEALAWFSELRAVQVRPSV